MLDIDRGRLFFGSIVVNLIADTDYAHRWYEYQSGFPSSNPRKIRF